jgi:hypothetical protein
MWSEVILVSLTPSKNGEGSATASSCLRRRKHQARQGSFMLERRKAEGGETTASASVIAWSRVRPGIFFSVRVR